jgi:hypothetical protein
MLNPPTTTALTLNEPERQVFKNFVSIYCELHMQMLLQGTNITQMYSLVHLGCDILLL